MVLSSELLTLICHRENNQKLTFRQLGFSRAKTVRLTFKSSYNHFGY